MTPGERVAAAALRYLGCTESPRGSNRGTCVTRIQASTGAYGQAWCGSLVKRAFLDAGVDDDDIMSASTWLTVENARRQGALVDKPFPGCVIVWRPGANGHMAIVRYVTGPSSIRDIGGNVSDMVKESYRSTAGAYLIAPRALRVAPPVPVYRTVYWWEDPRAEPDRHGLYAATASREKAVRLWVEVNGSPGHVRRGKLSIRDDRGRLVPRYTFWTGPRKRSPDFTVKAKRDSDMKKVAAARPGHILRPRSKRERVS